MVGPVPCARLVMPRGRDPLMVVGSMVVELVGFCFEEDLLVECVKGTRRSQQRKILTIDELTVTIRELDETYPSFDPLLMRLYG